MKTKKIVATIKETSYKCTSVNGNPSRWVRFTDDSGRVFWGYTGTDYSCGYGVTNFLNEKVEIEYHITKNGNIVIEFIHHHSLQF